MMWQRQFHSVAAVAAVLGVFVLLAAACGGDEAPDVGGMDAAVDTGTAVPDAGSDTNRPDIGGPRDGGRPNVDASGLDAASDADAGGGIDAGPLTAARCFGGVYAGTPPVAPEYDSYMPTIGAHCLGTNHQAITGVERVVFLGDSVTVGSPPTLTDQMYRNIVADGLASRFGLDAPSILWRQVNWDSGRTLQQESGDFASCAEWGANAKDFFPAQDQLGRCFPESARNERTLVIMTMGGNDVASITEDGVDGVPIDEIWNNVRAFVQHMEDAVRWLKEPGRFPNGVFVVFANMFEFTDGTGDVTACPAAELAGFGTAWDDPTILAEMIAFAEQEYLRVAVETGSDMIFMLEEFCGRGFNHADPAAPCYRGPGAPNWFDVSCIHPNPAGHAAIANMFLSVVDE